MSKLGNNQRNSGQGGPAGAEVSAQNTSSGNHDRSRSQPTNANGGDHDEIETMGTPAPAGGTRLDPISEASKAAAEMSSGRQIQKGGFESQEKRNVGSNYLSSLGNSL